MRFLEVLVEGSSDALVVAEALGRHFGLADGADFRVIRHRGKGALPTDPLARPDPVRRGLLDQLPAKLRGYAHLPPDYAVVVLVDADDEDSGELARDLADMIDALPQRPSTVLFRIAVEETESWFIAQPDAVAEAYPRADVRRLQQIPPDARVGAWERLAEAIGRRPETCTGADKHDWASRIAPHLDFDDRRSPSMGAFVAGIAELLDA